MPQQIDDVELIKKLRFDVLDFPAAWAIQKDRGPALPHDKECSSVPGWHPLSGPGMLCDCGAVLTEWERLKECRNRLTT